MTGFVNADMSPDANDFPYVIGYFGPPALRKDYERQVATPVGAPCILCGEAVAEGDTGTVDAGGRVTHHECAMRGITGSVGHQLRRCSCFGGKQEDPPGFTRRQSAIAAAGVWLILKGKQP